ncbi:DUF3050 domain-containing protein [Pedobacter sp. LMG 31464]|uniref:DUF3050 domain-containing protein n=1 Tax=Pedobacter planticolens TaxID=2679964 RepID=A0A923IWG2_9SPHI|nr:DUF3050 domain-containing protein [Pedobacter planticolens]MBB2147106.1 DUF3050 domain-containing protein [Pedobacter planticolens]
MSEYLERIQQSIAPLRQQIINHKLYAAIKDIKDLKIFMRYHVYAVWDFMSLLKSLQNNLTCTSVPWFPTGSADTRYLINEIVAGEESDVDSFGIRKSHFEIYLDAMTQCDADTIEIEKFITSLKNKVDLPLAFLQAKTPRAAEDFVQHTFKIIESNQSHIQSAVFTFGREDLIPAMFISIVNDIHQQFPDSISIFKYYLERHIEVDGDHHSHLALAMTANLCGTNEEFWEQATEATIQSLQKRINLWDGALADILERKNVTNHLLLQ